MTDSVAAQTPVTEHVGNGVSTSFAYTFQLLDQADLVVELDGVVQGSGFTVSGVGVLAGGTVSFTAAPASGVSVLLRRSTDLSRSTAYTYAGDLRETVVDADFNRLWHAMQERAEETGRAVRAPAGETIGDMPAAANRASRMLAFGADGDPVASSFTSDQVASAVAAAYAGGAAADAIGYAPVDGAVTTVQKKLEQHVSAFDFMTAAEIADVEAGTLLLDVGPKIQAAIDSVYSRGGGEVFLHPGRYKSSVTLYMRRGVTLVGPEHRIPTASLYGGNVEATIYGLARIHPTAAVTASAVFWNFKDSDKLRRPYGAMVRNLMVDCTDMVSGDGVHITCLPPPAVPGGPGEGVFGNGWAGASTSVDGLIVVHAPRYGLFCESTDNEKINVQILRSRFGFCQTGIYCLKCFDVKIDYTFSFHNDEHGIVMEGCATERVEDCDVFNNRGHGIIMDGFDGRYDNVANENNYMHGYYIRASTTTITSKRYRFVGGRIGTNSYGFDNTYDNVHIEDRAGIGLDSITFIGVVFSPQAPVFPVGTPAKYVRHMIHCTAESQYAANYLIGCYIIGNGRYPGNPYLNDAAMKSFHMIGTPDGTGLLIAPVWRNFSVWTGFGQPSVYRSLNHYQTNNVASATLAGFFQGGDTTRFIGREVYVLINDAFTGIDFTGTTLKGNGGVDLVAGAGNIGKILHAKCVDGTNWACQILG